MKSVILLKLLLVYAALQSCDSPPLSECKTISKIWTPFDETLKPDHKVRNLIRITKNDTSLNGHSLSEEKVFKLLETAKSSETAPYLVVETDRSKDCEELGVQLSKIASAAGCGTETFCMLSQSGELLQ